MKTPEKYTPLVLRIGASFVFFWFGANQIRYPDIWSGILPSFVPEVLSLPANVLLRINGSLEIVLGVFLLLGLYTRIAAGITAFHHFMIILMLGYNDVAVRDFGLMLGAIALAFSGGGYLSLDEKIHKRKKIN